MANHPAAAKLHIKIPTGRGVPYNRCKAPHFSSSDCTCLIPQTTLKYTAVFKLKKESIMVHVSTLVVLLLLVVASTLVQQAIAITDWFGCQDDSFKREAQPEGGYMCVKRSIQETCSGYYDAQKKWQCCPRGQLFMLDDATETGACCNPVDVYMVDKLNKPHGGCCPKGQSYQYSLLGGKGECCASGFGYSFDARTQTGFCCPKEKFWDGNGCADNPIKEQQATPVATKPMEGQQPAATSCCAGHTAQSNVMAPQPLKEQQPAKNDAAQSNIIAPQPLKEQQPAKNDAAQSNIIAPQPLKEQQPAKNDKIPTPPTPVVPSPEKPVKQQSSYCQQQKICPSSCNDIGLKYGHCYTITYPDGDGLNRAASNEYRKGAAYSVDIPFRVCTVGKDCQYTDKSLSRQDGFLLRDERGVSAANSKGWVYSLALGAHFLFLADAPTLKTATDYASGIVPFVGKPSCLGDGCSICLSTQIKQGPGLGLVCPVEEQHAFGATVNANMCMRFVFYEIKCDEDMCPASASI